MITETNPSAKNAEHPQSTSPATDIRPSAAPLPGTGPATASKVRPTVSQEKFDNVTRTMLSDLGDEPQTREAIRLLALMFHVVP